MPKVKTRIAMTFACVMALTASAAAQAWPTRPVTMVIPFAAGGPIDTLVRNLQPYLNDALGQSTIVDNVSGAGGTTGSLRVMNATPDGYTIEMGSIGTHAINQSLHKKPPYDAATDFAPVILTADAPLVLIVRKDLPVKNLQEFIAYVKANHGKMTFGSGGTGTSSQMGCVLLNQTIGVDVVHVPYRGGGPALQDLIAGRIDYICNYVSTALTAAQSGQARVIAPLTLRRVAAFPDIPTADEQGLKDLDVSAWNAIFAPKATPRPIIDKLNAAVSKSLDNPALVKRLDDIGLIVPPPERRTPEYLGKYVAAEIKKWEAPVKASGTTAD